MWGLASPSRLRALGIVGMNKRNVVYIANNNPRHLYPQVDDKLKTKLLCAAHNIPVPPLLGVCEYQHQVRGLAAFLEEYPNFVMKPAKGSGGKGILVIVGRDGRNYRKPSGDLVSEKEITHHASNTLSGLYSLGGKNDVAVIEGLVQATDLFRDFSYEGVPDVRVIVFRGYPVMAMMRLSTHRSDGKANLHQGAVGVGIDIASGRALKAVQHARLITHHPDTGKALDKLLIPHWQQVLELAARSFEVCGMGYLGADIVLDKHSGPLLLELNARPGLAIQIANGKGLEPRLAMAAQQADNGAHPPLARVAFARRHLAAL